MNIWGLVGIFIAIFVGAYLIRNKIVIHFDTFFRRGFHKMSDTYGVYTFVGKQGDGKTYSRLRFY